MRALEMLERARLSSRHADRQRLAASGIPQSTSAWVRFLDNHARTFRQQWLAKGVGIPADGVKNDRSPCVRADTASRVHPPAALGGNITRHSIILVGSVLARAPKAERLATSICVPTVGQCVGTSASERRRFACYVTSNAMAKWHLQRSPFIVTILIALIASIGFLMDKKLAFTVGPFNVQFATVVPLIGALGTCLFYFLDRYHYHRLLVGSVNHAITIEKKYRDDVPELSLSDAIGKQSPYRPRGFIRFVAWLAVREPRYKETGDLHSDGKIELFYKSVIVGLVLAAAIIAWMGGVTVEKSLNLFTDFCLGTA
jgi:hypothetical protein